MTSAHEPASPSTPRPVPATTSLARGVRAARRADDLIAGAETVLAVASMAVMALLVFLPLVLRNLIAQGLLSAESVGDYGWMGQGARLGLVWSAFLGASLATRTRRHIVVDVVTRSVGLAKRLILTLLSHAACAVLCGGLALVAGHVCAAKWADRTVLPQVGYGPAHVILPVALAIMSVRFLLHALEDLDGHLRGDPSHLAAYEELGGLSAEAAPAPEAVAQDPASAAASDSAPSLREEARP